MTLSNWQNFAFAISSYISKIAEQEMFRRKINILMTAEVLSQKGLAEGVTEAATHRWFRDRDELNDRS